MQFKDFVKQMTHKNNLIDESDGGWDMSGVHGSTWSVINPESLKVNFLFFIKKPKIAFLVPIVN